MKPEQIRYLNGPRLARAAVAGANAVALNRETLDAINVFPVADGDTGTNLMATLRAVASAAHHATQKSISRVGRALAEAAVDGARGNSGAILASFFSGFADGLGNDEKIDGAGLVAAAEAGAGAAREAVQNPREGTILSVASRWAKGLRRGVERIGNDDMAPVLAEGLAAARQALADTPKEMALLASAGVVDAGALGFVEMLQGIDRLLSRRGALAEMRESLADLPPPPHLEGGGADIAFRYCTEVLIEGEGLDRSAVRVSLVDIGDSLVVAGGKTRIRVHVHTDDPEELFWRAAKFGKLSFTKADDMKAQNAMSFAMTESEGVIVMADSTCDLSESDVARIDRVALIVRFGPEEFLDGVTLRPEDFVDKLKSSQHSPTTSLAAPSDFRRAFERHLRRGAKIVSIHVSSELSGTHQAAKRAAEALDPDHSRIRIIDGRSASVGLTLVVHAARAAASEGKSLDEVAAAAEDASRRTRTFCTLSTLKYLVKGGRVSAGNARIGELFRIRPILAISGADGKVQIAGKGFGFNRARAKMISFLEKEGAGRPGTKIAVTQVGALRAATVLAAELAERFRVDPGSIGITAASPSLAAHAGPGALGVAILPAK